ncbi:MAG: mandelate racemase/muconate lactonizing enzyme family protein [Candidatus Poribacteria bacterium]
MKIKISNAHVHHLQAPIENKVKTSFGVMDFRDAVFILIEDDSGFQGIGESWVNFPSWAPWERVVAFEKAFIPYLKERKIDCIPSFIENMAKVFRGPALQSGTLGPYLQSICAVEMALWDLAAKMENLPLNKLLFENPASKIRLYGSGINSPILWRVIDEHLKKGISLYKLKLGFGDEEDLKNLRDLSKHLGNSASIAVDVNRGWNIDKTLEWLDILKDFNVQWLEEPLIIEDEDKLGILHERKIVNIAGGENMFIEPGCDIEHFADAPLDIFQPDITKYCCLHDAIRLLNAVKVRGKKLFPHFLGSAPGQAASFHLASGCGGDCPMEWDINANPLRTALFKEPFEIKDGVVEIPYGPGIGWNLDFEVIERLSV